MIKLKNTSKIVEINDSTEKNKLAKNKQHQQPHAGPAIRPRVVDAKVYKVKSAFVKNAVFITLSYVETEFGRRPIEIFINSKDLNRAPEYVVLTRLISAIFRRATDPMFILEELHGIHDPNGGSFKDGKYYHSFYAEVAETIESFFYDVGIMKKDNSDTNVNKITENIPSPILEEKAPIKHNNIESINSEFRVCPDCSFKSLKTESGCDTCMECGYSKCDK